MSSIEMRIPVSSTSPNFEFIAVPNVFIEDERFIYAAIKGGKEQFNSLSFFVNIL